MVLRTVLLDLDGPEQRGDTPVTSQSMIAKKNRARDGKPMALNIYDRQPRWRGSLRPLAGGRLMGDPLIPSSPDSLTNPH